MRSRIFEEYAKIATKQGLVKEAADEDGTDGHGGHLKVDMGKTDYSSRENYKRKDLSSSEILYGLEPNGKEKHIMEEAHPEPVIIAPSYDKINGLVENNIERNNIMVNQVLEETDGNLNYKKLAQQELVFELVRIANDLDIRGEEELRALADSCIENLALQKEAGLLDDLKSLLNERLDDAGETAKGAAAGAVIGGIIGSIVPGAGTLAGAGVGAVAGGLIAAITKTSPQAKTVVINSKDTVDQVNDLIKKFPNKAFLSNLKEQVIKLSEVASRYVAMFDTPTGASNLSQEMTKKLTTEYREQMKVVRAAAAEFNKKAAGGEFADPNESNWWAKIQTGFHAFMDDDVDDVKDSLAALLRTINAAEAGMEEVKNEAAKQSVSKPQENRPAPPAQTPAAPAQPAQPAQPAPGIANKQPEEDEELLRF